MTRILLVQTASPKRVRSKAEEILAAGVCADPEVTILCEEDAEVVRFFSDLPGVTVVPLVRERREGIIKAMRHARFDLQHTFWTGESRYRRMRAAGLLIGARIETRVHIGDRSSFRLTWKAIVRHAIFRWQHPLPTDHYEFVPPVADPMAAPRPGERVLILQSAEPSHVLRAMRRLQESPVFRSPSYTLFCRNTPETLQQLGKHPMLESVLAHTEMRGTWTYLRQFRHEGYDAVVVFFTGDPSYWKMKFFAFLLGARHKLVFNENNDCFFFTARNGAALLAHRMRERSSIQALPHWGWAHHVRVALLVATKVLLLPFRFAWLLLVWVRLRATARNA
jgi:hypothetical protein